MDPPQAAFSFSLARARCVKKKRTEDLYSHSVAHIVARFFERKGDTTRTAAEERASERTTRGTRRRIAVTRCSININSSARPLLVIFFSEHRAEKRTTVLEETG